MSQDVQDGFRHGDVLLDEVAGVGRKMVRYIYAEHDAGQGDGLLQKAFGNAPDDTRNKEQKDDDVQCVHVAIPT